MLDADLGVGGRHLVVISGTAIPNWKTDDDTTHRQSCRVKLHYPAGTVEQSTVHVGPAAISNDDTSWVFATDLSHLEVNPAGELELVTDLAVMGQPSTLIRFSYQVVLTTRVVVTEITGTIKWPAVMFNPNSATPAGISGVFTIMAYLRTTTAGPPGGFGPTEHLTPSTPGTIVAVNLADGMWSASYRIAEPPKGAELKVGVTQDGSLKVPGQEVSLAAQSNNILTLSVAQPTAVVDWLAASYKDPA